MRALTAIDDQITSDGVTRKDRKKLISQLIDSVGRFDSTVIDEMSCEIAGQKLTVSSRVEGNTTGLIDSSRKKKKKKAK